METTNISSKSFFQKPEGKVGKWVLVLVGIAAAFGLYHIMPFIVTLLTNTLHAVMLFGALAVILFIVTNKQVQNLVSWGFKMLMRGITGAFVELNPIAIMKIYIQSLQKDHETMNEHIIKVAGEITTLERKITQNAGQVEHSLKIASAAKEKGVQGEMWKEARKAERRRQSTINLSELLNKLKKIKSVLTKMYDVSGYVIEDLIDDVEQKEIEYKTVKEAHAALKSSMSIINGDPDKRAMFELALEKMEEDVSQKLGTMSRFMEMSDSVINSIDIEQGIFAEDGLLMLEEYDKGGFDDFFKDFSRNGSPEKILANQKVGLQLNEMAKDVQYQSVHQDQSSGKYF